MPTRDGDVVIMHDGDAAAPDQYVLWTATRNGQQRPRNIADLLVTGFEAARRLAMFRAAVSSGRVFLRQLDTPAWTEISR